MTGSPNEANRPHHLPIQAAMHQRPQKDHIDIPRILDKNAEELVTNGYKGALCRLRAYQHGLN